MPSRVRIGAVLLAAIAAIGSVTFLAPKQAGAGAPAGAVYTWFDDDSGQLCDGVVSVTNNVQDPAPSRFTSSTAVAAGQSHTEVVDPTGAAFGCGFNKSGQLGNGTTISTTSPVKALLPQGVVVTAIAAGWKTNLALTTTGAVYSWGYNQTGQVGDGSQRNNRLTPVQVHLPVPAGVTATGVAEGIDFSLAVTSTGSVYAWGDNTYGQLGNGTSSPTPSPLPARVQLPAGVVATGVGAGDYHGLVVTSAGSIYAFGRNQFGQLGDGNTTMSAVPVLVSLPGGVTATQVAAGGVSPTGTGGGDYSLAVTSTGKVYAWGAGGRGQLGNNTLSNSSFPVVTQLPTGAVATSVGGGPNFGHALTTDGNVYEWGKGKGVINRVPIATVLPAGLRAVAVSVGADGAQSAAVMVPSSGPVASMTITPTTSTVAAGVTQRYTVTGFDRFGTNLGDVTGATGFVVTNGSCIANACKSTTAGIHTVTATDGSAQTTAALTVTPGQLASLTTTPTSSTVAAGATQTYTVTGKDKFGNSLGDVTGSTSFGVTNGSCTANVCGSSTAGTQTVTATDGSITTTAVLTVSSSPVASLTINPTTSTVAAGGTQTYTVTGYDASANSLGNVTGLTGFVVTNGSCTANVCGSSVAGTQTVTATDGSAQTTAALTVTPGPVASLTINPTTSTIAAGGTQTYTVTGQDGFANSLGDVTGSTGFVVTNGATCSANVCGSSTPGTYTVTATDGGIITTATLTVSSTPSWSAQVVQPNAVTGAGPGATTLNGQLWTTWRIPTTNQVAIAGYDPTTTNWTAPVIQPVGTSNSSPGIAALNGKLYVVWTGRGGTANQVALSAYDPVATTWTTISYDSQALSANSPAITAFNGQPWVAWKSASSNQVGYASYNPVAGTWSTPALHPQAATGNRPALAVVGNFLYLGWTTTGAQVGYSFYDSNTSTWSSPATQPAAANLKAGPALTASGSLLYAAWTTGTHTIGYASYDPVTTLWSAMAVHPQAAADNGPALTLVGSKLALVWKVHSLNELDYSSYG